MAELEKKYKKVESSDAEDHWNQQYESSESTCSHAYWYVVWAHTVMSVTIIDNIRKNRFVDESLKLAVYTVRW